MPSREVSPSVRLENRQISLARALDMFEEQFRKHHPGSQFLIDGEGYEEEDLDVNIYVDADEIRAGKTAAAISVQLLQQTGYLILVSVMSFSPYFDSASLKLEIMDGAP